MRRLWILVAATVTVAAAAVVAAGHWGRDPQPVAVASTSSQATSAAPAPHPAMAPATVAASDGAAAPGTAPMHEVRAPSESARHTPSPDADPRMASPAHPDPAAAAAAAFRSRDGSIEFRVPQPTDAEWDDYQQMLRHPAYRSSGTNSPGFALPYDPEWRSIDRGRRDAPAVDAELQGGFATAEALAQEILAALSARKLDRLLQLPLTRAEFVGICWPEFPQSRPYLKIPEAEAWSFQHTKCSEAAMSALRTWGGRPYLLDRIAVARTSQYRNFVLHEGVILHAKDTETGRLEAIDVVPAIVERNGRFKVFIYGE